MLRRTWAKTAMGAVLVSLTLGTLAQAKDPHDVRIAYSVSELANPWCRQVVAGMEKACQELGIQCKVLDAHNNTEKQVRELDEVIDAKYDGIMATAVNVVDTNKVFARAQKEGIVTGSIGQDSEYANMIYNLDEFAYGEAIGANAGRWAKLNLQCHGKVALLTQDDFDNVRARGDGIVKGLQSECPAINIVARLPAGEVFRGMMVTNLMLPRDPDVNMLIATNDTGGIGGYIVFMANQFVDSKRGVFSGDAIPDVLELMKAPNSAYRGTVDIKPQEVGYNSTKLVYQMVQEGVSIEPVVRSYTLDPITQEEVRAGQ